MKRRLLKSLAVAASLFAVQASAQVRFIDPVFPAVTKTSNVEYDSNASVNIMFGYPGIPSPLFSNKLKCDIYQPTGDTAAKRPLIILAHTGSFLPALVNKQATGNKNDSTIVEIAMSFAKRGYVVAAIDYRTGWNPLETDQAQATEQLLKATIRAMQDVRNAVRFFRTEAATYKIDTAKIIFGGQGTGGYVALALGSVSQRTDIESNPKFKRGDFTPMVNMDTLGDWTGLGGWAPMNYGANAAISSNVHMTFNFGGAMGDTAWMKASSLPMVCMQNTVDYFAPYHTGNVIVPTTGKTVIPNASGAGDVIPKANKMGINAKLNSVGYVDPISTRAMVVANGENNLYGFTGISPLDVAPWEFWNRAYIQAVPAVPYAGSPNFAPYNGFIPANGREADSLSFMTNSTMSAAKGKDYCDTIVKFVAPRVAVQFNITGPLTLNPFNLVSPASASAYTIKNVDSLAFVLRWTKSEVPSAMPGTTIYTVLLDSVNGNFKNPLFAFPLPGMDSLPIKQNQIFGFVPSSGSVTLYWKIVASNNMYSLSSTNVNSIVLSQPVGMEMMDMSSFVSVYPNPAKDQVQISIDNGKSPMSSLVIYDIMGREISTASQINSNNFTVNTSGFMPGMYFVNVKAGNGATASKRFIIQ